MGFKIGGPIPIGKFKIGGPIGKLYEEIAHMYLIHVAGSVLSDLIGFSKSLVNKIQTSG